MECAALPAGEPGSVEEDARSIDEASVGCRVIAEQPAIECGCVELEVLLWQRGGQCRNVSSLLVAVDLGTE